MNFLKKILSRIPSVSNSFDPDQVRRFVGPDLDPNFLKRLLADATRRQRVNFVLFISFRNFDFLIPDAPELIAEFLEGEQDMSCKRNAFMMLIHADQVGS